MFKRPSTHYGKSPTRDALSARRPGLGRPVSAAPRAGQKLAAHGLRLAVLSLGFRRALVWQSANGSSCPGWCRSTSSVSANRRAATADYRPTDPQIALPPRASSSRSRASRRCHHRAPELAARLISPRIAARWRSTITPGRTSLRQGRGSRSRWTCQRHRASPELPRRLDRAALSGRLARLDRTLVRHPHRRRADRATPTRSANPLGISSTPSTGRRADNDATASAKPPPGCRTSGFPGTLRRFRKSALPLNIHPLCRRSPARRIRRRTSPTDNELTVPAVRTPQFPAGAWWVAQKPLPLPRQLKPVGRDVSPRRSRRSDGARQRPMPPALVQPPGRLHQFDAGLSLRRWRALSGLCLAGADHRHRAPARRAARRAPAPSPPATPFAGSSATPRQHGMGNQVHILVKPTRPT